MDGWGAIEVGGGGRMMNIAAAAIHAVMGHVEDGSECESDPRRRGVGDRVGTNGECWRRRWWRRRRVGGAGLLEWRPMCDSNPIATTTAHSEPAANEAARLSRGWWLVHPERESRYEEAGDEPRHLSIVAPPASRGRRRQ